MRCLAEASRGGEDEGAPTQQVPLRDARSIWPRIRIPADFPRYRLQSGRIHRKQAADIELVDLRFVRLPAASNGVATMTLSGLCP